MSTLTSQLVKYYIQKLLSQLKKILLKSVGPFSQPLNVSGSKQTVQQLLDFKRHIIGSVFCCSGMIKELKGYASDNFNLFTGLFRWKCR